MRRPRHGDTFLISKGDPPTSCTPFIQIVFAQIGTQTLALVTFLFQETGVID